MILEQGKVVYGINAKLNQAFRGVLAVTGGKFADITLIGKGTVC